MFKIGVHNGFHFFSIIQIENAVVQQRRKIESENKVIVLPKLLFSANAIACELGVTE